MPDGPQVQQWLDNGSDWQLTLRAVNSPQRALQLSTLSKHKFTGPDPPGYYAKVVQDTGMK